VDVDVERHIITLLPPLSIDFFYWMTRTHRQFNQCPTMGSLTINDFSTLFETFFQISQCPTTGPSMIENDLLDSVDAYRCPSMVRDVF
jgi:hypothetical protein